jgi:hypothetical protein
MREIDAFLAAYKPKFYLPACLSTVTAREDEDVRQAVNALLAERRAETQAAD